MASILREAEPELPDRLETVTFGLCTILSNLPDGGVGTLARLVRQLELSSRFTDKNYPLAVRATQAWVASEFVMSHNTSFLYLPLLFPEAATTLLQLKLHEAEVQTSNPPNNVLPISRLIVQLLGTKINNNKISLRNLAVELHADSEGSVERKLSTDLADSFLNPLPHMHAGTYALVDNCFWLVSFLFPT
ncbi:hypothetical protein BABINDRAFT_159333 [Babjeviella inositovora NRRL Y-12698]|uniref:Uncharacterized protein n=1 Tax=Babjeviella inositovora NRRL Y-12698 TaxID=984486 RepID=A0A1E3QYT6_9ASCO|nr:uncharacterized protein BABINDRAFT_159333 [Babjeviella inositovora NRRL Y-12698]ODQ82833.1 hypothetical protein BABINDRAFT_159333 [Babjeviella inositovora NRRL Y-12698]